MKKKLLLAWLLCVSNLSFGLSSSKSEEFAQQILGFSGEINGQGPFMRQKSTRDESKQPEYEGEKPKTQVNTLWGDQSLNWYDQLVFKDPSFSFEFIRTLGYSVSGGADVGESFNTARAITEGNIASWYTQWLQTADRLNNLGMLLENENNPISAQELYFRASNYYRTAGLYMVAEEDRDKSIATFAESKRCFLKAIAHLPWAKPIAIAYENSNLPGYWLQSSRPEAPLLIIHTGFDGTAEELYFETGLAAHLRGYNVILFEGPGQGDVLRQQKIPFRPDWEKVVTPVIDVAINLPGVDKTRIALMGISMGGYLAARAAAFDERITACIVNGGVYSVAGNIYNNFPPDITQALQNDPAKFNLAMQNAMKTNVTTQWFFNNAMWAFGASTPAEVMQKLKLYTLDGIVDKIKCTMLVIDSEGDIFYQGQPEKVYNALRSPKTLMKFTAEQAAQAHCQMGAIRISNEMILNWLGKQLKYTPLAE